MAAYKIENRVVALTEEKTTNRLLRKFRVQPSLMHHHPDSKLLCVGISARFVFKDFVHVNIPWNMFIRRAERSLRTEKSCDRIYGGELSVANRKKSVGTNDEHVLEVPVPFGYSHETPYEFKYLGSGEEFTLELMDNEYTSSCESVSLLLQLKIEKRVRFEEVQFGGAHQIHAPGEEAITISFPYDFGPNCDEKNCDHNHRDCKKQRLINRVEVTLGVVDNEKVHVYKKPVNILLTIPQLDGKSLNLEMEKTVFDGINLFPFPQSINLMYVCDFGLQFMPSKGNISCTIEFLGESIPNELIVEPKVVMEYYIN